MYKKISDYGIIGDMHSIALVSTDGSIDYCSMPHIDSPTVFASLLDDEKGGYFKIQPKENFESKQEYIKDTNILTCIFRTKEGHAQLFDFMPVGTYQLFETKEHSIHRCLKVTKGKIDFILECLPRPQYATSIPLIEKEGNIFKIKSGREFFNLVVKIGDYKVIKNNNSVIIQFSLQDGQSAHFDFIYGSLIHQELEMCNLDEAKRFWVDWLDGCIVGSCSFLGEYTGMVNRSLLVLKLLTFQPTGAVSAASTTSLPESIAGQRNWDYRFSWIRDASFTLKALFSLGHIQEADAFVHWLHNTYQKHGSKNLQIMYSLDGRSNLTEQKLKHLKGYKDSRPVRIGNAAYKQNQWDIYGEIMDAALRLSDYVGKIDYNLWPFFRDVCNLAIENWKRPDEGIWEVRNGPSHFVYSKVMCWVALDRGITIASRYGFDAPLERWQQEKERIKKDVLIKGYNKQLNSFVQSYNSKQLDSSLLLLGLMKFLPFDDERIKATIEACKNQLMKNGFLLRYKANDGIEGKEAYFVLCNFWLIECMVQLGNVNEAKAILNVTLKAANHLGLFSEEYDIEKNLMLGNFPQAFSHIGFINAVYSILNMEHRIVRNLQRNTWKDRMTKLVPFRIVLNESEEKFIKANKDIASHLKKSLNDLQGAYFDILDSKVNYEAMKKSINFAQYVDLAKKLNGFSLSSLKGDEEKKAFWINIYNILIIHGVIELGVQNSVKEIFNFFNRIGYLIGGLYFTPDDIEHGILRANRVRPGLRLKQFSMLDKRRSLCVSEFDARIHFALVCASNSCPPIEFYGAESIDEQLDIAGRSFVNRKGMIVDEDKNILFLSQIFKWYFSDFGKNQEEVVKYMLRFTNEELKVKILENLNNLRIKYLPYDWNLNKILK